MCKGSKIYNYIISALIISLGILILNFSNLPGLISKVSAVPLYQLPVHGWYVCADFGMGFEPKMPEERQIFNLCHGDGWVLRAYCIDPGYPAPPIGRFCSRITDDTFWCGDDVQEVKILELEITPTPMPDIPTPTMTLTFTLTPTSTATNTPTQTPTLTSTDPPTVTPTNTATITLTPSETAFYDPTGTPTHFEDPTGTPVLPDDPPTRVIPGGSNTSTQSGYLIVIGLAFCLVTASGIIIISRKQTSG